MSPADERAGRCAIVGKPNVGKSTLLNALLGQKLVIATSKAQTTRSSVLGVYVREHPPTQIAFVDTPGIHRPRSALGRSLMEEAKGGLADADVALCVVEVGPSTRPIDVRLELEQLLPWVGKRTSVLALNKVDRLQQKPKLLPLLKTCAARHSFAAMVPISAKRGTNLPELLEALRKLLPEGLLYDPAVFTDKSERFFVAELIREAVLNQVHQEVPHGVAVQIDQYEQQRALVRLAATVFVERKSHKGILIGAGGRQLKAIGTAARLEIEAFLGRKVFVELWVRVAQDWTRDSAAVRRLRGESA